MKIPSTVFLSILFLGLLGFVGWISISAYQQRQGPALDSTSEPLFSTRTPSSTSHSSTPKVPASTSTKIVPSSVEKTESPTLEKNATPAAELIASATSTESVSKNSSSLSSNLCGETGAWNILVIGSNIAEVYGQKGSDLTRIIRADFSSPKVVMYTFSRDLWVDTSGLGLTNPNLEYSKLGFVFYEGRIRSLQFALTDTIVDGTRSTAGMLSQNFSVKTDHYITIDISHLAAMIDAIGGLPMNIPSRTTDPWIGMVIEAGQQTLTGAQVVAYVRAIPDNDFGRIQRNDLIVEALRQKMLNSDILSRFPELFSKFKNVIITDMSFEQISHLACLLKETPAGSIIKEGVRQEWTSVGPAGSLLWKSENVLSRLRELGLIQ
jgi:LCP family protein required for cell wall assembly